MWNEEGPVEFAVGEPVKLREAVSWPKSRKAFDNRMPARRCPTKMQSHQVCARRRDGEAAGTVSGRERHRCMQIVCHSRMA